ncbi:immunoglobulin-like and fibronectin type III domain-containing protein 1 [Pleurodeles waltl]
MKKSLLPGVKLTQTTEDVLPGCSPPDIERKPIPLTIQEGKTAMFKVVVTGEPRPEVRWQRGKGDISNPSKCKSMYDSIMNEFILQVFNVTPEDADSYCCTAINAYGEATCMTNLKIIEIGFKKKANRPNEKHQEDMKKELLDLRKNLKKRVAKPVAKQEPMPQQKVIEVLLNADKKDYEKICFKYGITDFRGVLKRLQQMKKDREDHQAKYVTSVSNLKHIKVTPEGNGVFELELELKDPNCRIFLYKDGELIRYGLDTKKSPFLRQIGKRYIFTILDVNPRDVGRYQVKVEDADVFSTELDLNSIPVSFVSQLKEARCQEGGSATFQCTLSRPSQETMWVYKEKTLESTNKYDISISPDGLTHTLLVNDVRLMDKGSYKFVSGIRSSSAWLVVEASKDNDFDSKGRRKKVDGSSIGSDQSASQSDIFGAGNQGNGKKPGYEGIFGDQDTDQVKDSQIILNILHSLDESGSTEKDALMDRGQEQEGNSGSESDWYKTHGLNGNKDGFEGIGFDFLNRSSTKGDTQLKQEGSDSKNSVLGDGLDPSDQYRSDGIQDGLDMQEGSKMANRSITGLNSETCSNMSANDSLRADPCDGKGVFSSMGHQSGNSADIGSQFGSECGTEDESTRVLNVVQPSPGDGGQLLDGAGNYRPPDGLSETLSEDNNTSGADDGALHSGSRMGLDTDLGIASAHGRRGKTSLLDVPEFSSSDKLKLKDDQYGRAMLGEPTCHFACGLSDVQAQKGKTVMLSCTLTSGEVEGAWFKDGRKLSSGDALTILKDGSDHKLVIDKVDDAHAGRYTFEAGGHKSEASVFVEDPPQVEQHILDGLLKEPIVVRAGQNTMVKVPFVGRKPIKAIWYLDDAELTDDGRIHIDHAPNFSRLSITKANRKDSGNIKLRLKNESGTIEANMQLVVIDRPQPPKGPVEVLESTPTVIGIQWKPPKDDGGKPLHHYVVERQQVGRSTWLKLGEVPPDSTTFSTSKVDHGKRYYFRVRAVNAEGVSEAIESEEVMAGSKALPGSPPAPSVIAVNSQAITLSWMAPHNKGSSRIQGYHVEKRKSGSHSWTAVTEKPIPDRRYTVTDLGQGLQYEFRVIAVNDIGPGEPSRPSETVFARDPMRPPDAVRDLRVTDSSYTTIALSWVKPLSENRDYAKGYFVEMRAVESIHWMRCNTAPIGMTTYTVKGLRPKHAYYLRVIAVNDGGLSEPKELDTQVLAMPTAVRPKFLIDANLKSFMAVRSGNAIRVLIPYEASPEPDVLWKKDGIPLSRRATVTSREGLSQLLIPCADYTDSGIYTIMLKNYFGKETFNFEIQVADIPKPPGPVRLEENVTNTVTVAWGPSPDEKRDCNLSYVVMKRDNSQQSWHVVGDPVFTTRFTITRVIPGRQYHFRVLAKNDMGLSDPSDTSEAWSISKEKARFLVKKPLQKQLDQRQAPEFIARLKPHVVPCGFDCHMTCAVRGNPEPQVTWYRNGKNISEDRRLWSSSIVGVCSLVIPCVSLEDGGEYTVVARNSLGEATCKATMAVTTGFTSF